MIRMTTTFIALSLASVLAACGQDQRHSGDQQDHANHAAPSSADHEDGTHHQSGDVGHGRGVIRSVGAQGDFLTIEHGPIEGVGMGAMTMGFDILGDVDLSDFSDGDEVAFGVKRGRDNSYRIVAICNIGADGEDCLEGMLEN